MKRPVNDTWHAEALRMRAQGMTQARIGAELGVHQRTIGKFLCAHGFPTRMAGLKRKPRIKAGPRRKEGWRQVFPKMPQPQRGPRQLRQVIDRQAVMPAAEAFARGEIDRAELMRRISPTRIGDDA